MRITCPNCGAQYEVDDALIPEAGRDVQCSNCGKGWFQTRPEAEAAPVAADAIEAEAAGQDTPDAHDAEDRPAEEAPLEARDTTVAHAPADAEPGMAEPAAELAEEDVPQDADPDEDDDSDEEPPALPPVAVPRKPDEAVLSVLREEAQREIAQRRQDAGPLESQPDLGLATPPERRITPPSAEIVAGAAVAASARRDLLPDIDEINSTLRPDVLRGAGDDDEITGIEGRRRGFRLGFGLMLTLAGLLIALYVGADWLVATVPALEPLVIAYVDAANALRDWMDGLLARGVTAMGG